MNVLFSLFVLFVANYLRINDISNNYKGVWDILFSLLFTNFAKSKKGEIMEKENIMTVDIEDFKKSQHILDYIDDDFAIVNSLDGIPYSNDTVRLNCFLIAVCAEGCIQLDINYRTYQLQAGDLLLGLPNTLISRTMLSPKYKIRLAGFLPVFCNALLKWRRKRGIPLLISTTIR